MKRLAIASALLAASTIAQAEYKDVIAIEMTGECTFDELMVLVGSFNKIAEPRGYSAQIFMPGASNDMKTYYWVGTSPDTATFGEAHDWWMGGVMSGEGQQAELQSEFDECTTQKSRQFFHAF